VGGRKIVKKNLPNFWMGFLKLIEKSVNLIKPKKKDVENSSYNSIIPKMGNEKNVKIKKWVLVFSKLKTKF